MDSTANIVLIGMPGVGKSTVGVLLAKLLGRGFCDTDLAIQTRTGRRLQDIIDSDGTAAFCRIEAETVLALDLRGCVIATGGSVVYSDAAMRRLKAEGLIVHLDLSLPTLVKRLRDISGRGVVMAPGQSLADLYAERMPLYRRWADVTLLCEGLNHDQVLARLLPLVRPEDWRA